MLSLPPTAATSFGRSLATLPAEVLLEIIPQIPYTPHSLSCLCLTCAKLNGIIKSHEHSLVDEIKTGQFCAHTLALFPGLNAQTFTGLSNLYHRLGILDDMHGHWLKIVNHSLELQWLKGKWEQIHKAGLLLLYRIQDAGGYAAKVELLQSLPATSLACLMFKLVASVKILRVYGPSPIHAGYCRSDPAVRSDVELAFEELLLHHGPDFFVAMLKAGHPEKSAEAVRALELEIETMYLRQLPYPNGDAKPRTLISSLRRALAEKTHSEINQTVHKMWEILSVTAFDDLDSKKLAKIVGGVPIEGGLKRMGF